MCPHSQSQTTTSNALNVFYKVILSSHSLGKPSGAGEESSSIRYAVLLGNTSIKEQPTAVSVAGEGLPSTHPFSLFKS